MPIDKIMLSRLIEALEHTISCHSKRLLFQAMFSLAFHAFLRIGEITVLSKNQSNPNLIMVDQIELSDTSAIITFHTFKHSQGQTCKIHIIANESSYHCPIKIIKRYMQIRGTSHGPLFQLCQDVPVSRSEFNHQLIQALQYCNFDTDQFKSHSFRIGAATTAAAQGFSDSQIRMLGRWKSDAFKQYIRCSNRLSNL